MKLGEFFVSKGIINAAQLEEALRGQLIFGGHLGTCLLEMGFIDEHLLGRTLAEMFGVDYAPPHFLNDIPKSVIDLLPKRLAEKLHAVPFEKKDKTLQVAMIDPKNLPALDELAFATGHRIVPWVTPEARIFQVLERYYEVPRRQRYITVCQDMDRPGATTSGRLPTMPARDSFGNAYAPPPHLADITRAAQSTPEEEREQGYGIPSATPMASRGTAAAAAAAAAAPTSASARPTASDPATARPPAPDFASARPPAPESASVRQPAPAAVPAAAPAATPAASPAPRTAAQAATPAAPAAPEPAPARMSHPPASPPAAPARPPAPPPSASLPYARALTPSGRLETFQPPTHDDALQNALTDLFVAAENASEVADIALNHATRTLSRAALFLVKGTIATLWRWKANGPATAPVVPVNLSVTNDPPFDLLLGREFYQGELPHNPKLTSLYGPLGVSLPTEVLLIPGYLEDRLVVVLYGDGTGGPVQADIADLDLLVRKLSCTLQLVLIKKKIRSYERIGRSESVEKIA